MTILSEEVTDSLNLIQNTDLEFATLGSQWQYVDAIADGHNDPNARDSIWNLYSTIGGITILIDSARMNQIDIPERLFAGVKVQGAATLKATTMGQPTTTPVTAVLIGYGNQSSL